MTHDDRAFREVDEALAEDRQRAFIEKNGSALIAGGAAIVLAVAGWQFWNAQKKANAEQAAIEYSTAVETLAQSPEEGRAALAAVEESASRGYRLLAKMRRAASLANTDREAALAIYRELYTNGAAPKRLRELARLRAASLAFSDGRDAVLSDLGALPDSNSPLGYYAAELAAVAALEAGDYEGAEEMFRAAAADPMAPTPVRQRAEEFAALAAAGKAGVNLTGKAQVDDLLEALGAADSEEGAAGAPTEAGAADGNAGGDGGGAADEAAPEQKSATGKEQ